MKKERQKFYFCKQCNNIIGLINNAGVPLVCCGDEMTELVPNTVDASAEKHVPIVKVNDNKVKVSVGSAAHPMIDEHFIEWIYIQTQKGGQRKTLKPGEEPEVEFALIDDKAEIAFAYCNLHGLWMTEL